MGCIVALSVAVGGYFDILVRGLAVKTVRHRLLAFTRVHGTLLGMVRPSWSSAHNKCTVNRIRLSRYAAVRAIRCPLQTIPDVRIVLLCTT